MKKLDKDAPGTTSHAMHTNAVSAVAAKETIRTAAQNRYKEYSELGLLEERKRFAQPNGTRLDLGTIHGQKIIAYIGGSGPQPSVVFERRPGIYSQEVLLHTHIKDIAEATLSANLSHGIIKFAVNYKKAPEGKPLKLGHGTTAIIKGRGEKANVIFERDGLYTDKKVPLFVRPR